MAYDEVLAAQVRSMVEDEPAVTEKRMFGGLGFLVGGHLAVSASGQDGLMVRVDPARTEALLDPPHVQRVEMRGRELDGWLRVNTGALATEEDLSYWVEQGVGYARTLPPGRA